MEFNAGIFSFTGARKSPLNMFPPRELPTRAAGKAAAQAAAMSIPLGIFPYSIKGWSGLELPLTCRKGDFAEDLSEQGKQAKASWTS
jgi:hypothetical protein